MNLIHSTIWCGLLSLQGFSNAFHTTNHMMKDSRNLYDVSLKSNSDPNDNDIIASMETQGLSKQNQDTIISHLSRTGLWEEGQPSNTLSVLAQDFVERPEVFSTILINDFGFPALVAHQTRAVAMAVVKNAAVATYDQQQQEEAKNQEQQQQSQLIVKIEPWTIRRDKATTKPNQSPVDFTTKATGKQTTSSTDKNGSKSSETTLDQEQKPRRDGFKKVVVNEKAKARRKNGNYEYALNEKMFPQLADDLLAFYAFMTRPSPHSQEDPIRPATADVYMRHVRQFLGWYVKEKGKEVESDDSLSLLRVIPDKEKESATDVIDFVLWLRSRDVSVSYEANILRGLTKLLKFRFSRESKCDPSNGGNTFDDIPLIKEIRKLHRDANKRQRLAPRSSNEQRKWLSWPEYLQVIKEMKNELLGLIEDYFSPESSCRKEKVAEAYQCYLILALFANIPDRQRTMRELAIGSTLVKNEETNLWAVKHGPDDYKTGKSYGERPTIQFREELSQAIDDYIDNWRSVLDPSTEFLFVQSRTGKPLTGDGIFQRVSRCCFKYGGKKTNPHLLRDMIVTHVRESDASEKELEALALYMGHSLNMQRTSYDRRTLTTKIAPAVELMHSINTDT
jgi:phosphorylcholine metabolism protein LicD